MSFMDGREGGSKPGSGGAASSQNEVCMTAHPQCHGAGPLNEQSILQVVFCSFRQVCVLCQRSLQGHP